jgi:hypothetical protein
MNWLNFVFLLLFMLFSINNGKICTKFKVSSTEKKEEICIDEICSVIVNDQAIIYLWEDIKVSWWKYYRRNC